MIPNANRVSIIIPAYNAASYLAEAIESSLAQTHPPHEIIIIDDGSTDDTASVAARFPVRFVRQANAGPAAARNHGWHISTGDFLQFLDADDVLLPTKLECCLAAFTPEIDVVYTDHELRSPDLRQVLPTPRASTPEGDILLPLLHSSRALFPIHAPLIRRSAADRTGGFSDQAGNIEDWYFWIDLAARGARFRYLDAILVWYRTTPGSRSSSTIRMALGRLQAAEALRRLPLPPEFDLEALLADRHHVLGLRYWAAASDGTPAEIPPRRAAREQFRQALHLSSHGRWVRWGLIALSYVMPLRPAETLLNGVQRLRMLVRR